MERGGTIVLVTRPHITGDNIYIDFRTVLIYRLRKLRGAEGRGPHPPTRRNFTFPMDAARASGYRVLLTKNRIFGVVTLRDVARHASGRRAITFPRVTIRRKVQNFNFYGAGRSRLIRLIIPFRFIVAVCSCGTVD